MIKFPEFLDEAESKFGKSIGLGSIFEFLKLIYRDEIPGKGPPHDLKHINLHGLPVPSKDIVEKLYGFESYKGYDEEWNWRYFASEWDYMKDYRIKDYKYKRKYSRGWINKSHS